MCHMLDVGACAERLIEGHRTFATLSPAQRQAFVILAALHDVGKISDTFRSLLRDGRPGAYRHWKLSDVLLTRALDPILAKTLGGDGHARGELYAAVSGHHGGPERSNDRRELWRRTRASPCTSRHSASTSSSPRTLTRCPLRSATSTTVSDPDPPDIDSPSPPPARTTPPASPPRPTSGHAAN